MLLHIHMLLIRIKTTWCTTCNLVSKYRYLYIMSPPKMHITVHHHTNTHTHTKTKVLILLTKHVKYLIQIKSSSKPPKTITGLVGKKVRCNLPTMKHKSKHTVIQRPKTCKIHTKHSSQYWWQWVHRKIIMASSLFFFATPVSTLPNCLPKTATMAFTTAEKFLHIFKNNGERNERQTDLCKYYASICYSTM